MYYPTFRYASYLGLSVSAVSCHAIAQDLHVMYIGRLKVQATEVGGMIEDFTV